MSCLKLGQVLALAISQRTQPFMRVAQSCCSRSRSFSSRTTQRSYNKRKEPTTIESPLPNAPPFSDEDLRFVKDLKLDDLAEVKDHEQLPVPPDIMKELDPGFENDIPRSEKDEEEIIEEDEDERLPPPPPNFLEPSSQLTASDKMDDPISQSPEFQELLQAVHRALDLSQTERGPMPLHELANRSKKVKELVKLGINLWSISLRHAQLERLLHLNWDTQIKPQIRFLVDLGIEPQNLGTILSSCPTLLWTSSDDLQVRKNYLEAKGFTDEMIRGIFNQAPFWLSLSTRELDNRLGFLQRTFQLTGNEVRKFAVNFPRTVSTYNKWDVLVHTTKLMERQFGFNEKERKEILLKTPSCYLNPLNVYDAFQYLHHEVGMNHSQLVQHVNLLATRIHTLKPRHQFLKFVQRDQFNPTEPGYVSPDWLWKGTVQEFCQNAARRSVEDYELFLKTL